MARDAGDSVEILFQPNPREKRTVPGVAKIIEAKTQQGQTCYVVQVLTSSEPIAFLKNQMRKVL